MTETTNLTAEAVRLFRLLAARLRAVPEDEFDMGNWFSPSSHQGGDDHPCKSAACAMGYACMMSEFNAVGLVASRANPMGNGGVPKLRRSAGASLFEWEAIRELFGISHEESSDLFLGTRYAHDRYGEDVEPGTTRPTPTQVAQRIEEFVAARPVLTPEVM